jgi:hypothetical protein
MLIWLDAASYNRETLKDADFVRPLTLDISSERFSQAKIYYPTALDLPDPNDGVLPVQTLNAPGRIALKVPDQLTIVEMIP